jgi:hypothetical protein
LERLVRVSRNEDTTAEIDFIRNDQAGAHVPVFQTKRNRKRTNFAGEGITSRPIRQQNPSTSPRFYPAPLPARLVARELAENVVW